MEILNSMVQIEEIVSRELKRSVRVNFYVSHDEFRDVIPDILVMNDGQDLVTMNFESMLSQMVEAGETGPLVIAAVYAGADRQHEYGMAVGPNYRGWGSKAGAYSRFITTELLPYIENKFGETGAKEIAGFSLGGLSALDIAWNHPEIFSRVGVFSGSLWWRSVDKDDRSYDPWVHRMMHHQIATTPAPAEMKFFFACGEFDEEEDRNKNGVIDSIDDTIDVMRLLLEKGFLEGRDFRYVQLSGGRHDVASWGKVLPEYLKRVKGER